MDRFNWLIAMSGIMMTRRALKFTRRLWKEAASFESHYHQRGRVPLKFGLFDHSDWCISLSTASMTPYFEFSLPEMVLPLLITARSIDNAGGCWWWQEVLGLGGSSQSDRSASISAGSRLAEQPLELGAMAVHFYQSPELRRIHHLRVALHFAGTAEGVDAGFPLHCRHSCRFASINTQRSHRWDWKTPFNVRARRIDDVVHHLHFQSHHLEGKNHFHIHQRVRPSPWIHRRPKWTSFY